MPTLKLAKLPARTPVKITVLVTPELHRTLEKYAECYREAYGESEKIGDLIPYMLETFLALDKDFAKARRGGESKTPGEAA